MKIFFRRFLSFTLALVCMFSLFTAIPSATVEAAIGLEAEVSATTAIRSGSVAKSTITIKCTGTTAKLNKVYRLSISVNNGGKLSKTSIWAKSGSVTLTMPKFDDSYKVTVKALDSNGKTLDTTTKTIKAPKFTGHYLSVSSVKGKNNESSVTIKFYTSAKQTSAFFEARDSVNTYKRGASGTISLSKSKNGYYYGSKTITMKTGKWNFWIDSNYNSTGLSKNNVSV